MNAPASEQHPKRTTSSMHEGFPHLGRRAKEKERIWESCEDQRSEVQRQPEVG